MTTLRLLRRRRFLPLFCTQLLNAFNDNLYKTAMVLFVVYQVYNSEEAEGMFSAVASGLFILPFFILSALAGQLADMRDKAKIIRTVKMCEIGLMMIGAAGLYMAWRGIMVHTVAIPLLLLALFLTGVQSTFLGPIKYAILPQHLKKDEVLAGTGLVEAGTYIAILMGTILACRAVAPEMIERKAGRIITIGSIAGSSGRTNGAIYSVAKAGVHSFTRCLAAQLRPHNIPVNCVAPGGTVTARFLRIQEIEDERLTEEGTLDRYGRPREVSGVVGFLCTPAADFVSGQVIRVDGATQTFAG